MRIILTIPMGPVPQPRHRFRAMLPAIEWFERFGCVPARAFRKMLSREVRTVAYPPPGEYIRFKAAVADAYRATVTRHEPIEGRPIAVDIVGVSERPKSKTRKTKPNERYWDIRCSAPGFDCDNLEKAVLDALTGVCWKDDGLIVDQRTRIYVAGDGDAIETVVTITDAGPVRTGLFELEPEGCDENDQRND